VIPVVILFTLVQRYLTEGLRGGGATKGLNSTLALVSPLAASLSNKGPGLCDTLASTPVCCTM
jgi:hypothetical protein